MYLLDSSTHLPSAWYESVERERRLCWQREYRPIRRASIHAGSTVFLLSPQAEKHSRYLAQSPLVTLVDGEQSFGGGPFPMLGEATKCDSGSPVASSSVADCLRHTSSLLPISI